MFLTQKMGGGGGGGGGGGEEGGDFYRKTFVPKFFPLKVSLHLYMGLAARKPVFGVSDKMRLKPACSATETS